MLDTRFYAGGSWSAAHPNEGQRSCAGFRPGALAVPVDGHASPMGEDRETILARLVTSRMSDGLLSSWARGRDFSS